MATATSEIDDIRRKMARIRRELHEDVRGVVESAEAVSDWKYYIRLYPWASVGVALAVGYLIVPKRKKSTPKPAEVARAVAAEMPQAVQAVQAIAEPPKKKGRGLIGAGLGMLAPIAWRAAQNYAMQFLSNWVAQNQQGQMAQLLAMAGLGPVPDAAEGPEATAYPGAAFAGGPAPTAPRGPTQTQGGSR